MTIRNQRHTFMNIVEKVLKVLSLESISCHTYKITIRGDNYNKLIFCLQTALRAAQCVEKIKGQRIKIISYNYLLGYYGQET